MMISNERWFNKVRNYIILSFFPFSLFPFWGVFFGCPQTWPPCWRWSGCICCSEDLSNSLRAMMYIYLYWSRLIWSILYKYGQLFRPLGVWHLLTISSLLHCPMWCMTKSFCSSSTIYISGGLAQWPVNFLTGRQVCVLWVEHGLKYAKYGV